MIFSLFCSFFGCAIEIDKPNKPEKPDKQDRRNNNFPLHKRPEIVPHEMFVFPGME
jgi:hypothetical protein